MRALGGCGLRGRGLASRLACSGDPAGAPCAAAAARTTARPVSLTAGALRGAACLTQSVVPGLGTRRLTSAFIQPFELKPAQPAAASHSAESCPASRVQVCAREGGSGVAVRPPPHHRKGRACVMSTPALVEL